MSIKLLNDALPGQIKTLPRPNLGIRRWAGCWRGRAFCCKRTAGFAAFVRVIVGRFVIWCGGARAGWSEWPVHAENDNIAKLAKLYCCTTSGLTREASQSLPSQLAPVRS